MSHYYATDDDLLSACIHVIAAGRGLDCCASQALYDLCVSLREEKKTDHSPLTVGSIASLVGTPPVNKSDGICHWVIQSYWSGDYLIEYDPTWVPAPRVVVYYRTYIPNRGMEQLYLCELVTGLDLRRFLSLLATRDLDAEKHNA